MLQQTQAPRVVAKYKEFLKNFPTIKTLAKAPLKKVVLVWQGLGYNRRAVNLHRAAKAISKLRSFPKTKQALINLSGIGSTTAGDTLAFAFNKPEIVIETNIRTVFIHCFFKDKKSVHDKEILPLIEKTLDKKNPREWYFALMDYGASLKKTYSNPSRRSKHYAKQSPFKGSNRELRSKILKYFLVYGKHPATIVAKALSMPNEIVKNNIEKMKKEGLL